MRLQLGLGIWKTQHGFEVSHVIIYADDIYVDIYGIRTEKSFSGGVVDIVDIDSDISIRARN